MWILAFATAFLCVSLNAGNNLNMRARIYLSTCDNEWTTFILCPTGQKARLTWNGNQLVNNSMVSNQQLYYSYYSYYYGTTTSYTPVRCELTGNSSAASRQWYSPTGAALPSRNMSSSRGYGQTLVQATGVDLYSGGAYSITLGVHRCDIVDGNGTLYRLYVAIYNDPSLVGSSTASCEFSILLYFNPKTEGDRHMQNLISFEVLFQLSVSWTVQFLGRPISAGDTSAGHPASVPAGLHQHVFSRHYRPMDAQRQSSKYYQLCHLSVADGSSIVHLQEHPSGDREDGWQLLLHCYDLVRTSMR